jgi:hypothetical protein
VTIYTGGVQIVFTTYEYITTHIYYSYLLLIFLGSLCLTVVSCKYDDQRSSIYALVVHMSLHCEYIYLSIYLFIYLYISISISIYLYIYISIYLYI